MVNFLDVNLNLTTGIHRIYHKPNTHPQYVHTESNHPPRVINNIPLGINRRLSSLSSDNSTFTTEIDIYQQALKHSGHNYKLAFQPDQTINAQNNDKKTRRRHILWYNPPFNKNVATNIGKIFFNIIDTEFPKSHALHKIFNRNSVKISYSCMNNVSSIISAHNTRLLQHHNNTPTLTEPRECNCRNMNGCPLQGKCLSKSIIYRATVTTNDQSADEHYIGLTDTTFKQRYYNHMSSFRNEGKRSSTELSKHIWALKDQNIDYNIKWSIVRRAASYNKTTGRCNLCLYEKFYIIYQPNIATLNKRCELVSTCRHAGKFLLSNFKT